VLSGNTVHLLLVIVIVIVVIQLCSKRTMALATPPPSQPSGTLTLERCGWTGYDGRDGVRRDGGKRSWARSAVWRSRRQPLRSRHCECLILGAEVALEAIFPRLTLLLRSAAPLPPVECNPHNGH
jgi:hypothetical protein